MGLNYLEVYVFEHFGSRTKLPLPQKSCNKSDRLTFSVHETGLLRIHPCVSFCLHVQD